MSTDHSPSLPGSRDYRSAVWRLAVVGTVLGCSLFATSANGQPAGMGNLNSRTQITVTTIYYDRGNKETRATIKIENTSKQPLLSPLWLAVAGLPSGVRLTADGMMPDGTPYADFSTRMVNGTLPPGQSVTRQVGFQNPALVRIAPVWTIWGNPTVNVTPQANPTSGPVPLAVVFDATVVGNITLYEWDFDGDGIYDSSGATPHTSYTYATVGTFNATCRVTDSSGVSVIGTVVISTSPGLRAIAQANPTSGVRPLTVTFTPSGISTGPPILWYTWDYNGDGYYDSAQLPRPEVTTYTYTSSGVYNATLRVQDGAGATATDSVAVTVMNAPPTATASVNPTNGPAPLQVQFAGSGSSPNGAITRYEWDFDGDGTFDYSSPTTGNTSHMFDTPGDRQPLFRVTDALGLTATVSSFLVSVRVGEPQSPTGVATVTPASGNAPLNVTFGCSGTQDPDGTIVFYEWDFEYDGTFTPDFTSPTTCATTYTYTAGGVHYVALRVTDNDGKTGLDVKAVTVNITASVTIPDDTFNPHAGETTYVRTSLSAGADVHVYIKDRVGNSRRSLFHGSRPGGTYNDPWNGRDDAGVLLVDADYYAYIDYTVGGTTNTRPNTASGNTEYVATYSTNPANGGGFNPWHDQFWELKFNTSSRGGSEVSVWITPYYVGNVVVAQPMNREVFGAGLHTTWWDGVTYTGKYISDEPSLNTGNGGDFLFSARGYTLPDNAIVIEGGRPVVTNPSAEPNHFDPSTPTCLAPPGTQIGMTLSKPGRITLRAFNMDTNSLVRELTSAELPAGTHAVAWDGRVQSGLYASPGAYRVEITATSADGNVSRTRTVLTKVRY